VFREAGTHLFPAAQDDLITDCTCPDWANPCKHVAAVYYLLGERFDDDPYLLFLLRGRSREAIGHALRLRRVGAAAPEAATAVEEPAEEEVEEDVTPLTASVGSFWSMPEELAGMPLHFEAPSIDALPVKQRGRPAFWRGDPDFTAAMEEMYRAIERDVHRMVAGGE